MRKNTAVKFIKHSKPSYNPETGEYDAITESTTTLYCNATPLSSERSFKEFGEYIQGGVTVRTTTNDDFKFDEFEINGEVYIAKSFIKSLGRTTIVGVRKHGQL